MAKKKYLFFSAVFSAYFIVFAVSPILGRAEFSRAYGQTCNAFNVKLLIADLLQAGHGTPDNHLHPANILLKKKRAILSDSSETVGNYDQCVSAQAHPDTPDEIRHTVAHQDAPRRSQNVQRHHSGLSPPSA